MATPASDPRKAAHLAAHQSHLGIAREFRATGNLGCAKAHEDAAQAHLEASEGLRWTSGRRAQFASITRLMARQLSDEARQLTGRDALNEAILDLFEKGGL